MPDARLPLLDHDLAAPSVLRPEDLMAAVRQERAVDEGAVPAICVLEFDGDLTSWLMREGLAHPHRSWACFHTAMQVVDCDGVAVGLVDRTIGGPFAVLIAEQLHAAGARLVVGLTSAGRVRTDLPLPCVVVADSAIRDEGTSLHYLPPSRSVDCPTPIGGGLARALGEIGVSVHRGQVWTTDAPYRETASQLAHWAGAGVLAVEMQTASLFAYGQARGADVAAVAIVSNGPEHTGPQFDTGGMPLGHEVLRAIARGGQAYLGETGGTR